MSDSNIKRRTILLETKSTMVFQTVLVAIIFSSLVSHTRMLTMFMPSNIPERPTQAPSMAAGGADSTDGPSRDAI